MNVTTKQDLLNSLLLRFKQSYGNGMQLADGRHTNQIIAALVAEKELTIENAVRIIGNNSWLRNECDECGQDVEATVMLGQEPDCESATASVCFACLHKAVALDTSRNA